MESKEECLEFLINGVKYAMPFSLIKEVDFYNKRSVLGNGVYQHVDRGTEETHYYKMTRNFDEKNFVLFTLTKPRIVLSIDEIYEHSKMEKVKNRVIGSEYVQNPKKEIFELLTVESLNRKFI